MASCVNSDNQLQVRQFSPLRRSVQLILNFGRASGWQFGRFSWLLLIISLILAVSSPVRRAKRGRSFASLLMKLPEGYVNGVAPRKATAMGGFGQQMLESMGWQKGQGLGKESQGIVAPVEAAKKDDTVGLGGKRMWNWELDYAASAYETAMAKVRGDDATATSSSSSDSESDDEMETDDSVRSTSLQFAGVISSASAAELKLAKQLAKGNNLGRFGARAGKLARIQEQEAVLAAKMDPSKSTRQISGDAVAASTPSRRLGKTVVIESTEPVIERPPPALQPSSWWGHKAFLSSGWLRGLHEADRPTERQEFTASTQEDIYNRVKQNQRQVCRQAHVNAAASCDHDPSFDRLERAGESRHGKAAWQGCCSRLGRIESCI